VSKPLLRAQPDGPQPESDHYPPLNEGAPAPFEGPACGALCRNPAKMQVRQIEIIFRNLASDSSSNWNLNTRELQDSSIRK
jgi:hypothetical protein